MPSKRPAAGLEAYKDESTLWQAALERNGLVINCDSRTDAMQLIQRLHLCRQLDRNTTYEKTYSLFDQFIIRNPDKGTTIVIERRFDVKKLDVRYPDGTKADLDSARRAHAGRFSNETDTFIRNIGHNPDTIGAHDIDPDAPLDLD